MPAEFEIRKYVGKDCAFGSPVTSIGIKRVDQVVPAVYGVPVVPGDDKTDANTYSVYRPDDPEDSAHSFESIFKLILKNPPDNQLSNIKIYPNVEVPDDPNLPLLFIGVSKTFTRPTNQASMVAINNIWQYTEDNPFKVTVNGEQGQSVDEQVAEINFNASVNDVGFGNVIYLNEERQVDVNIVEGNTYQIINKATGDIDIRIYDEFDVLVVDPNITYALVGAEQVVTIFANASLLASFPNGFKYGSVSDVSVGGLIEWLDLSQDPIETEVYEVEVKEIRLHGDKVFYLNDMRSPRINFRQNRLYKFINKSGDTDPIRFLNTDTSMVANMENEIVIKGITVTDGGTVNEVVLVDPSAVKVAGERILSYQSSYHSCYGNGITNINTALVGNYNINTVGGGVANPLAAGETDFIYLQLRVTGKSTVGQAVPEIIIEYDEN